MVSSPVVEEFSLPQIQIGDKILVAWNAEPSQVHRDEQGQPVRVTFQQENGEKLELDLSNYDISRNPDPSQNVIRVKGQVTHGVSVLNINHFVFVGKNGIGSTTVAPRVSLLVAFKERRLPTYKMHRIDRERQGFADVGALGHRWVAVEASASWVR